LFAGGDIRDIAVKLYLHLVINILAERNPVFRIPNCGVGGSLLAAE